MTNDTFQHLTLTQTKVSIDGNVGIIYLNRPPSRNALTTVMIDELQSILSILDSDANVRVIILTGAENDGQAFCAGADLKVGNFSSNGVDARPERKNSPATLTTHRDGGGKIALALIKCRKPVIAAINGHAAGVGITMTLPCDIRIVWKDAKIGFVFPRRGIVPEAISTWFLPHLIGRSRALSILMRGQTLQASDPLLTELFTQQIENREQVLPTAVSVANEIAKYNSPLSMAFIKSLVWRSAYTPEEHHLLDSKAMHILGNTNESQELVKAFLDKSRRDDPFKGVERTAPDDWPSNFPPWWNEIDVRAENARSKL